MDNPNRIGLSITDSTTATCPIPSTLWYCQTGPCSFTGFPGSMATNSLVLDAGASSIGSPTGIIVPIPDPTYVAPLGTASAISAGVQAADQFGRNAYTIEYFQQ